MIETCFDVPSLFGVEIDIAPVVDDVDESLSSLLASSAEKCEFRRCDSASSFDANP
jgi:hypothetical protein